MTKDNKSLRTRVAKLEQAIYGDGNGDIGMKQEVTELHDFFMNAKFTGRFILGTITFIGVVASFFIPFLQPLWSAFKHLFYR